QVDEAGARGRLADGAPCTAAPGSDQIGQDHSGLHAEGDREDPGRNPWPITQQPRAPAIARWKSFEPGSGVHGLTGMSLIVVLKAPRERATARTQHRATPGAAAQSYGCGA